MKGKVSKIIVYTYLIIMLVIYPLAMNDIYFDITRTKRMILYSAFFVLVVGLVLLGLMNHKNIIDIKEKLFFYKWTFIFCAILLISLLITFIGNGASSVAFYGNDVLGLGLMFYLLLLVSSLIFLTLQFDEKGFLYLILGTSIIEAAICFLQFSGVDVGGWTSQIVDYQRNLFMGTIGNIEYVGFYFVVVFPFAVYALQRKEMQIIGTLAIFCSALGIVVSNNDGSILAFAFEMAILFVFMSKAEEKLEVFFRLFVIIAFALMIIKFVSSYANEARPLGSIQKLSIHPVICVCLFVFGMIGIYLAKHRIALKIIRVKSLILLILLLMIPIYIFVYTCFIGKGTIPFLDNFLYFDIYWGTHRGYLWQSAIDIFANANLFGKLFGQGDGSFCRIYYYNYLETSQELGLYYNLDAHNMYLQFLCEYGLCGLISTLGIIATSVHRQLNSERDFDKYRAVALVGTLIAALFLVSQNITLGFLPILIG